MNLPLIKPSKQTKTMNQILFLISILILINHTNSESVNCLAVYKEGGAPAVLKSPKCPRWKLYNFGDGPRSVRCQVSRNQGRRRSMEDRAFCVSDLRIPFPGQAGLTEVAVGIVAVFDGHNGAEASEMASKLLLEYFMLHTYFLLDTTFSILSKKAVGKLPDYGAQKLITQALNWDEKLNQKAPNHGSYKLTCSTLCLDILKESLLRAINDIDSTFSKEATASNLNSGSTATVVLIADGQILVANIGDSKALLCSEEYQSPSQAKADFLRRYRQRRQTGGTRPVRYNGGFTSEASSQLAHFTAKELTRDHHPDRVDEKSRVESAGGDVLEWAGVSRVNGQLAVSRAIGDVSFKSYGVISTPEVTDWQLLTANDSFLVAASDGIFEKMTPQDVCDLLWELHIHGSLRSELAESCSYSLADCIVDTALEKGSMDNMAAVVVPLSPTDFYERFGDDNSVYGLQKSINEVPELDHSHPFMAKFDRLLVEGKQDSVGCFYLSENLSETVDHTFWLERVDHKVLNDLPQSLPNVLDLYKGGPLDLYYDHNMCLLFGMNANEDNGKCINPEGFASLLGLLESIPIQNSGPDDVSPEHAMPDSRYILRKRFGRGAFGEVWLGFHWNCSGVNASGRDPKNRKFPFNATHLNGHNRERDSKAKSSAEDSGCPSGDFFILKRIMVEKGGSVYLSGLREKHFGELFLNASTFQGDVLYSGIYEPFSEELISNSSACSETNESATLNVENPWKFGGGIGNRSRHIIIPYEQGLNNIARYVESFESQAGDMWLVFRHEGVSLSKLLYTAEEVETSDEANEEQTQRIRVLYPSKWWRWLKTTDSGQEELRNLIWQLLMAIKSCHDRNITHRDLKPENMVICFEDQQSGRCLKGVPSRDDKYKTKMRIIDFGSAVDEFTLKHLYGSAGPSRNEQTYEYTPPEALLNATWYKWRTETTLKYDMWSAGVIILEMILGSPDVFQISSFTGALLDRHLEGWNEEVKELAHKLRAFMELCILIPVSSSKNHHISGSKDKAAISPASWKCSEEYFAQQIKSRDPLKIGFPNVWALRLVRQLLAWDPDERLSADEALQHPFFHPN